MSLVTKKRNTKPKISFSKPACEWEWKLLDAVAKRGSGHTPDKNKPSYYDGDIPWISLADSNKLDSGLIAETKNTVSLEGIKNSSAVVHPAGSVLLSRDAGIGKSAVMASDMAVSQHFITWTCGHEINNWFLYYYLQTQKREFERIAVGSTIKTIGLPYFKKLEVPLAPRDEQDKIADFLGSVDAWLNNLRSQKTALETYKRGMMQKLFTQQVRFKDDNGNDFPDWEEKTLADISSKSNTGLAAGSLDDNEGEYPVYGASGLYKNIDFYQEEEPYIAIIKDGSGVGRTAIYPGKSSVIGTLNVIKPESGIDTYFLYMLVSQLNLLKYVIGGAIPHIYYKDYKREKVMVPTLEEQQKIADFLTAIDQTITAKAEEITHVEQWKKGLMQKMFV